MLFAGVFLGSGLDVPGRLLVLVLVELLYLVVVVGVPAVEMVVGVSQRESHKLR